MISDKDSAVSWVKIIFGLSGLLVPVLIFNLTLGPCKPVNYSIPRTALWPFLLIIVAIASTLALIQEMVKFSQNVQSGSRQNIFYAMVVIVIFIIFHLVNFKLFC